MHLSTRIRHLLLACVLLALPFPVWAGQPEEADLSQDAWHFEVSKAIALELADTPSWSLSAPYLREMSPKTQDWNLLLLLAKVELQHGEIQNAETVIQRALRENPGNPRIYAMAGNIAADAGKYDEAIQYMEHALEIQPKSAAYMQSLARIYFACKDWNHAIALYERALSRVSPTSEMYVRLATAYENVDELAKAEFYLKENLEIHPTRALALMPLERFYQRHADIYPGRAAEITAERNQLQKRDGDTRELRALQKSSK
ncbi:MAG: tetratricopeptide repeat protein [Proteobacteria bacterium]|nr:tetratricopeptide repeat protein [Pseudomonadota bacterium]